MPSLEVGGVATESSRGSPGIMKGSTFDTLCGYATQKKLSIFFRLAALVLRIEGSGGKLEEHKAAKAYLTQGTKIVHISRSAKLEKISRSAKLERPRTRV